MQFNIPIQQLKAANLCKANKDIRYYLEGIFLDSRGFIVGTDGHVMYSGKIDYSGPDYLFKTPSIPAQATIAEIDTDSNMITFGFKIGQPISQSVHIIDGRFPDWQGVFNSFSKSDSNIEIGIGAKAMAKVCKIAQVFGAKKAFKLELGKSSMDSMRIEITNKDQILLMPARY